jgi:hypothetical protein
VRKVFISSVVNDFEEYRQAAKRAVEIVGDKPIISEDFGAHPYSSEKTCITEVETSDVYIVILGENYGFVTPEDISVTQAEYRAAKDSGKLILAFIKKCEMEAKQREFRQEVEEYQEGLFRGTFLSPEELKEEIIKSLRLLNQFQNAVSEDVFKEKMKQSLLIVSNYTVNNGPQLIIGIWPNPPRDVDIVDIEHQLDSIFTKMCQEGLAIMKEGYDSIPERDWTGIKSGKSMMAFFPDGLLLICLSAVIEKDDFHFSSHFASPSRIKQLAMAAQKFIESNSCWFHIGLKGMNYVTVKELPKRNLNSGITMRTFGENETEFRKSFVPFTEQAYNNWLEQCIKRFQRIFS